MKIIEELKKRGLIKDITNENELENLLFDKSVYCGFDPTASSLHVGSLLPLITLLRLKRLGVSIKPLIGGSTGMIGDPSFKAKERSLNDLKTIETYKSEISKQIKRFLEQDGDKVELLDNFDWTKNINVLSFLRDVGKYFSVNQMIQKDSVKKRITENENGISFTEFAYQLLQAMDFYHLYKEKNCSIQIGGSDQWGNMIAGIDLIKKKEGNDKKVGVFTLPLLLKSNGEKFGKSETGAIWLSKEKTSAYQFFQFWLNISDNEVKEFFKKLSFRSVEEIDEILSKNANGKPIAQELLALELTQLVHGKEEVKKVKSVKKILFDQNWESVTENNINDLINGNIKVIKKENKELDLIQLLVDSELVNSKRIAREMLFNKAIKINGVIIQSESLKQQEYILNKESWIFDKYILIQKGKKSFSLVMFEKG